MLPVVCEEGDQPDHLHGLADADVVHQQDRLSKETVGEHLDDAHQLMPTGLQMRSGVLDLLFQGFVIPAMATIDCVQPFVEERQGLDAEESPELLLGPVIELFDSLIPIEVGWAVRVVLGELWKLRVGVKEPEVLVHLGDQFRDPLLVRQTSQGVTDGLGQS